MKQFLVKVNGNTYDVTVDEVGCIPASTAPAPTAAPVEAPKSAPSVAAPVSGGTEITAPMPGTILKLLVNVGDTVSENQPVVVLEAMKMENDIPATVGGKVLAVNVNQGDSVESGQALIVIG